MDTWLKVLISVVGFGAGAEALRQYQQWKTRRYERTDRNVGFWTDARVLWVEAIVVFAIAAIPFTIIVLMMSDRGLSFSYAGLLAYAVFSFTLLRGLNRPYGP